MRFISGYVEDVPVKQFCQTGSPEGDIDGVLLFGDVIYRDALSIPNDQEKYSGGVPAYAGRPVCRFLVRSAPLRV